MSVIRSCNVACTSGAVLWLYGCTLWYVAYILNRHWTWTLTYDHLQIWWRSLHCQVIQFRKLQMDTNTTSCCTCITEMVRDMSANYNITCHLQWPLVTHNPIFGDNSILERNQNSITVILSTTTYLSLRSPASNRSRTLLPVLLLELPNAVTSLLSYTLFIGSK